MWVDTRNLTHALFFILASFSRTVLSEVLVEVIIKISNCSFIILAIECERKKNNFEALQNNLKMTKQISY